MLLYCARPGSRIWEVNFSGEVLSTHQFKQLLACPPLPLITHRYRWSPRLNRFLKTSNVSACLFFFLSPETSLTTTRSRRAPSLWPSPDCCIWGNFQHFYQSFTKVTEIRLTEPSGSRVETKAFYPGLTQRFTSSRLRADKCSCGLKSKVPGFSETTNNHL